MTVSYATLYLPGSSQGIQVVEGSQLHLIYVAMGANSVPSAPGETVRQDPYPQYVDADELAAALAGVGGGDGGAVASVNGQTGAVVLDADDIAEGATNKAFTLAEKDKLADITPGATVYTDEQVRDLIGSTLVAGTGVTKTVDDAGNTVTLTAAGGGGTVATIPAGSVLYVNQNGDGTWPNRLTSRTDVKTIWTKIVAASADPASATSPAVNGAYANDVVIGV